ncbi:MAG: hypothetical protein Q9179_004460 [Wetmoreana sp. 5 TL-2023]
MNHQDNIRIFAEGVEDARHEQQARSQEVGSAVNLKLTVDLSKRNLYEVPEEVIDILGVDVERLQLAYNQICYIPDLFAQCRPLKYLNLRHNLFQEFPRPLFSLPQLEILDLSVNEIQTIPEGLGRMRSLRVLSLAKNKIRNIPPCVKDLDTLIMLKLAGNPLRSELAVIIEAKDTYPPYDEATDNERDLFTTLSLKQQLKVEAAVRESGEGSSEGPLETPRPLMRNGSLRFPIKPNGNDHESASEARSPGFAKPPIPARSHFRITSGQNNLMQKSGLHRPAPAPLNLGNERNRSNSESVLQGTQNNRSKRMGMIKKKNDLGTVEENQQKRSSFHLRGQSHASALRDWNHEGDIDGAATGSGHPASQQRPDDLLQPPGTLVPYLDKLRKHWKKQPKPRFIDAAKGVRYSLATFGQCTHSLIDSLPHQSPKQWYKLRDAQHEATFRMDNLHHSVKELFGIQAEKSLRSPRRSMKRAISLSTNACQSAVAKHIYLCKLLLDQSSQVLADGERMYARTLLWITLGSSVELCHTFARRSRRSKRATITQSPLFLKAGPVQASHRALREEPFRDQSLTPTRERPVTAKRVKNWNAPQQPTIPSTVKPAAPPQPAVPLYFNGRSRSNSRADQYSLPSSTDSTFAMSPAMTPSSTSQFSVPGTPLNRSRSSSIAAASAHGGRMTPATTNMYLENDYSLQTMHFDKVYKFLEETVVHGRKVLPTLEAHFREAFDEALKEADRAVCEEWSKRVRNCKITLELSDILLKRLQAVRHQDPNLRNEKSFWELCKKYLASISDLLNDVRAGYREGYVRQDIVNLMRPISKASRAAGHEIADSPWMQQLVSPASQAFMTAATSPPTNNGSNSIYTHHRHRRSSGSNSYTTNNVPATPLSVALGPAAQATVPSTPASSSSGALERSFQGGWGERADTLLMQQTMVYRR